MQQNMQQNILQSVLKITEQRNIEALEHCLPDSITELLPVKCITLYKSVLAQGHNGVEKIQRLSLLNKEVTPYQNDGPTPLSHNKLLQDCFESGNITEAALKDGISEIYLPITINGTTLSALYVESEKLDPSQRGILCSLTKVYSNYLAILNECERDKLTSLLNRHSFEHRFDTLISAQKSQQQAARHEYNQDEKRQHQDSGHIYLAMLDIDFFKRVNDVFGHIYGDEILLLMASLMRENFRSSDLLFRYGGEEFVILLAPTSAKQAYQTLERFRLKVENYDFPQVGKITISIGYTIVLEEKYVTTALNHADEALYYSKDNGRNCINSYEQLVENGDLVCAEKACSVDLF